MDIIDSVEPVTSLKSDSAKLIRKARESGQPIIITQNGKPSAVLMDVESFQNQRESLAMLKLLVQGDEDYRAGRTMSHDKAKIHFTERLKRLVLENG